MNNLPSEVRGMSYRDDNSDTELAPHDAALAVEKLLERPGVA